MVLLESCLSQLCFPSWPNVIPEIPPLKSSFPSDYIQNALKNKGISWKKYKQFIFCCFLEEKNMYKRYVQYVITWYMMYSSILRIYYYLLKKTKTKTEKRLKVTEDLYQIKVTFQGWRIQKSTLWWFLEIILNYFKIDQE